MAIYRVSRNIEANFIDFLRTTLTESPYSWTSINFLKGFSHAYELSTPTVAVRAENTIYDKVEIGTNSFVRTIQVYIDIFASDDGMKLDLKDSIIESLKDGLVYNEYTITSGVASYIPNGRIRIEEISDSAINFDVNKEKIDQHDKFRWLITCTVSIGRVE